MSRYYWIAEKVQWFRSQADMERWVEEAELLEEEFRRLIRGCEKMASVWLSLTEAKVKYQPIFTARQGSDQGYKSYAYQKADMYERMGLNARELFKTVGGEWPSLGESLSEHVRRRRPVTSVDWDEM